MNADTDFFASSGSFNVSTALNPAGALEPHFQVKTLLSCGGYGSVYLAVDYEQREYAIKVQKYNPRRAMLKHEAEVIQKLRFDPLTCSSSVGIPKFHQHFVKCGHEFLVMERLGDSLQRKMKDSPSGTLSKKTGLMAGIQIVRRLQLLHGNNILHRDIKPANFVMGLGAAEKIVNVIDFGLSEIVEDWVMYNPNEHHQFAGTYDYAPIEALFHEKPTRAGDLQSLVYAILEMVTGKLKWEYTDEVIGRRLTRYELGVQRLSITPTDLCGDFPELTNFAKLVFKINKVDKPNYDMLVQELNSALESIGCLNDGGFDWLHEEYRKENRNKGFRTLTGQVEDLLSNFHPDQVVEIPQLGDDPLLDVLPMVQAMAEYDGNDNADERELDFSGLPSILQDHEDKRNQEVAGIQKYFAKGAPDIMT